VLDFVGGFVGKGGAELFAADAMLWKQRTDPSHERTGKICGAPAIGVFDAIEQADRDRADSLVEQVLERPVRHYSTIPKKLALDAIRGGSRF
jgi:hypothetical protein